MAPRRTLAWLPLLIVLLAAATRLARSPYDASGLEVVPDSEEYAIGAQRVATLGRYDLEIDRVSYPPRYSPWFSAFLAPAYRIAPREIGAGIVPVFLITLSGIWAAFRIGRRIAGEPGGAAAAALLACNGFYGIFSREILTDAPGAAVALWACDLFLSRRERSPSSRLSWLPGTTVAIAASWRPEAAALLVPFLFESLRVRKGRALEFATLLAPSLVLLAATAIYQHAVFGDFRRNGYMFWCPVPCDYPSLMFSVDYLGRNLAEAAHAYFLLPMACGVIGMMSLFARGHRLRGGLLVFLSLGILPGILFHLFFFAAQERFNLPLIALACVVGGAGIVAGLPQSWLRRIPLAPVLIALVPAIVPRSPEPKPYRRVCADALASSTPENAVIVTALEPVYLEPFVLRGTRRRIVPANRRVEYASKAVAWKRVDPAGLVLDRSLGPRDPALFRGGAIDVCPFTADERPEQLAAWVREGVPVYLDRSFLSPKDVEQLHLEAVGLVAEKGTGSPWVQLLALRKS